MLGPFTAIRLRKMFLRRMPGGRALLESGSGRGEGSLGVKNSLHALLIPVTINCSTYHPVHVHVLYMYLVHVQL